MPNLNDALTAPVTPGSTASGPLAMADPIAAIENRNKMLEVITRAAIASTTASDWVKLGDRPWLTGYGAEKVARRCAVRVTDKHREKTWSEDEIGRYYVWTYSATFRLGDDSIEAEGHCTSRDQFLGTNPVEGEQGFRTEKRALSEVDEGNVMQAAYTNMFVNGVCRLLGVRNLTWDMIKGAAGVDAGQVAGVAYDKGGRGGGGRTAGVGAEVDEPLKFGRGKDRTLRQLSDDDVRWYCGVFEKDLADPDKAKFHASTRKRLAAAQALLAERAAPKAGAAAAPAAEGGAAAPAATGTPWEQVVAHGKRLGYEGAALAALVREVAGVSSSGKVTAAHVQPLLTEMEKRRAAATATAAQQQQEREPGSDDDLAGP